MKSILQSTLCWIFFLHLFCILMPFGMKESENKDMITYTSKKDLEENFIAHWKNPEKYAAFKLNDEIFPYASGFYVLRPYYQKLKICTDEKDDYGIEYSSYDKIWRLIRNPFYDPIVENLDLKDNTIATLLEGENFSYANSNEEDILAFKTFENVNAKNIRAGKEIKKLKTEIETKQQKIEYLKTTNDDLNHLMKKNDDLNNRLIRGNELFKNLKKDYQLMQEEKKLAFLKRAEALDDNENLREELEKKNHEIQKKNKEIQELQFQIGGLSYVESNMKETEKEIENLKKDVDPLKNENKKLNHEIKRLNNQIKVLKNQKEYPSSGSEISNGDSDATICSCNCENERTLLTEMLSAATIFKNMTRRYEMLITQIEQKTLTEDIEKLEKMKNKNHSTEMNQLIEKIYLKRQLFQFSTQHHNSEIKFLKNEIELDSALIDLNKMIMKEITENWTEEKKCIESNMKLYEKAKEYHVKELTSCREMYIKLQQNILDLEENYAKLN